MLRIVSRRFFATKFFTRDHEWVRLDTAKAVVTMGITDYAQKALGDVVFVEVPSVGKTVKQKDVVGAVESVKAASDIYAPLSGQVVEANEALLDNPATINSSPEDKGWLCKIKLSNKDEIASLLDDAKYKQHCESASNDA